MTKGVLKVDARKGLRLLLDLFLIELRTLAAIPPDHDRHCDEQRRIRTGDDADEHRQREVEDGAVAEAEECEHRKERRKGRDDRTGERHIDGTVAELHERSLLILAEVFTDAIEHHNRVVHGVTDDREDGRHHNERHLTSAEREESEGSVST